MDKWSEDRMVEINAAKQNIGKRMKTNEDRLQDLCTTWGQLNAPIFASQKETEKTWENIWRDNS